MRQMTRFCLPRRICRVAIIVGVCLMLSGQTGLFAAEAPLPTGVKAVWSLDKAWRVTTPTRERICINGLWRWQPGRTGRVPADNWGFIKIPAQTPGRRAGAQKHYPHPTWAARAAQTSSCWYQREVVMPANWTGRRIVLVATYLTQNATIYLDGVRAGQVRPRGGQADITEACRPGTKQLLSIALAETRGGRRGLYGDVYLESMPDGARIEDVKVDTSMRNWKISPDTALAGLEPKKRYRLRGQVLDGEKVVKEIRSKPFRKSDVTSGRFSFANAWKPDKLWDTHTPQNMYDLKLSLVDASGKVLDAFRPVHFGFREFRINGRDFTLNGTRLFCFAVPNSNYGSVTGASYDGARATFESLKSVGINLIYTHNYGSGVGSHVSYDEMLRAADDTGMLISLAVPHVNHFQWDVPDADERYAHHAEFYVRLAQNHPSVVFYSMNHNYAGYPHDMNPTLIDGIHNQTGKAAPRTDRAGVLALRGQEILRGFDNTRGIYHHAGGNIGQVHTSNFYINFVPIQERSDWFEHWATKGVKPVFLVEYGAPLGMSWTLHRGWDKGKWYDGPSEFTNGKFQYQFCSAEWGAQFRGDAAYDMLEGERQNIRFETRKWRAGETWFRWDYPLRVHTAPLTAANMDDVQAMYVRDNWRAFRTWGVSAYNYWIHSRLWKGERGTGVAAAPPKTDWEHLQRPGYSLDVARTPQRKLADVEPRKAGAAFMRNNRPLLAYIGGARKHFTEKGHNFNPGDTVKKQVIIINNSRETVTADCSWSLALPTPVSASTTVTVVTGQQARIPVRLALPANLKPGSYQISMAAKFDTGETQTDVFTIDVLQPIRPTRLKAKVALFDPKGETKKLLSKMGVRTRSVKAGDDLTGYPFLIIGKEAVTLTNAIPDVTRVRNGLKVILFEQTTDVLEKRFGFRVQEYGLRRVFARVPDHPLLEGLDNEKLHNWRGQATIVGSELDYQFSPGHFASIRWCDMMVTRPWRVGCWGNVATCLIEKPTSGDFLPLLDGGFNLQYSPLMQYREGKGMLLFCQMDVTGRTASDPAAARLTANILDYVSNWKPAASHKALYAGDPIGKAHLTRAGLSVEDYADGKLKASTVLIVGPGGAKQLAAGAKGVRRWLTDGGKLVAVGLDGNEANTFLANRITTRKAEHINAFFKVEGLGSPFAGIGPAEVLIRDARQLPLVSGGTDVIGNGVLARTGNVVFCQLIPWEFDPEKSGFYHTKISYRRTSFLLSRLAGNMNVAMTTPLLESVSTPLAPDALRRPDILGVIWLEGDGDEVFLPDRWKGLAIKGTDLPTGWENADFNDRTWRRIHVPGTWESQFADLVNHDGLFLYRLTFDVPARLAGKEVTLVLGAVDDEDWTWLNGHALGSHNQKTNPDDYWKAVRRYKLPKGLLKAGRNTLAVKVSDLRQAGGMKGSTLSRSGKDQRWLNGLYLDVPVAFDDPYRFYRW